MFIVSNVMQSHEGTKREKDPRDIITRLENSYDILQRQKIRNQT